MDTSLAQRHEQLCIGHVWTYRHTQLSMQIKRKRGVLWRWESAIYGGTCSEAGSGCEPSRVQTSRSISWALIGTQHDSNYSLLLEGSQKLGCKIQIEKGRCHKDLSAQLAEHLSQTYIIDNMYIYIFFKYVSCIILYEHGISSIMS